MRETGDVRLAVLTIAVLVAGFLGARQGVVTATVSPLALPPACPLVRTELIDRLVPGHGLLATRAQHKPGLRVADCLTERVATAAEPAASLYFAVGRFGRSEGKGPRCLDRDWLEIPLNRRVQPVALGDGAVYYLSGTAGSGRSVRLSACHGTLGVYAQYDVAGATDAAMVDAATAVVQEVLAGW